MLTGFRALRHPQVTADDRSPANGDASENGGIAINDDIVLQYRVARYALDGVAMFVEWEAPCTERHALIQLHVVADDARGPDDDARSVVDGEVVAYLRLRVYVDARLAVRHFRDDARNEWHTLKVEFVGDAVVRYGFNDRVATDYLAPTRSRGVAVIGSLHIRCQRAAQFGHHIYGYDNNRAAVAIAERNVKAAGLTNDVTIQFQDFADFTQPEEKSIIITNPPYGERIKPEDLLGLYKMIGSQFKKQFVDNEAWVLSYREECFDAIGLKASLKVPLFNGSLECELRKYQMFSGRYVEVRSEGRQIKSDDDRRQMAEKHRFKEKRSFKQGLNETDEEYEKRFEKMKEERRAHREFKERDEERPRRFNRDGDDRPRRFGKDDRKSDGFKRGGRDFNRGDSRKGGRDFNKGKGRRYED